MRDIQISTDVFSRIWALRLPGEESEDQILSRFLPLPSAPLAPQQPPPPPSGGPHKGAGKMRWVDDIVTALRRLGGTASLDEIYRTTRSIRQVGGRSIPRTFEAVIRRTLEDHSSDSANHRAEDLFKIIGRGTWALR